MYIYIYIYIIIIKTVKLVIETIDKGRYTNNCNISDNNKYQQCIRWIIYALY